MTRFSPSALISDCFGSVGEVSFFHRNGQCFFRKRPRPQFPGTVSQMERQGVHLRAIEAWRRLDHAMQLEWNDVARSVIVHRPPFDGSTHMSGYNLFVSAYHGFATLGEERVPEPVVWEEFPVYAMGGFKAAAASSGGLRLTFRTQAEVDLAPGRYRLLLRIQLTRAGGGRDGGKMRSFLAEGFLPGGPGMVSVYVPQLPDCWDVSPPSGTVYLRHTLLDVRTGYRSQWQLSSFMVNLP